MIDASVATIPSPPGRRAPESRRLSRHMCRFCQRELTNVVLDLGMSPLAQSCRTPDEADGVEHFYPLFVMLCDECRLMQLGEYVRPADIFEQYGYFSSYSDTWLDHARRYVEMISDRLRLDSNSQVVELASNDGYLLQYFVARGVPVLGVEPARNVAEVAKRNGVNTVSEFFGEQFAKRLVEDGVRADLLIGNNVLAHVPDINDFVAGLKILLAESGAVTMEFPHLMELIQQNQFDTIYHEHFSYFTLSVVRQIFASHGLRVFDVEQLPTHGGSLRIYACHADGPQPNLESVAKLCQQESDAGYLESDAYRNFAKQVAETKRTLLDFLIAQKRCGKRIVGYGAPAKGNTLLNYCGIGIDFIDFTVDRSPHKQGRYLPGVKIPIKSPEQIDEAKPDLIFILPWNLKDEIERQLAHARDWGAKFVVAIPELTVF